MATITVTRAAGAFAQLARMHLVAAVGLRLNGGLKTSLSPLAHFLQRARLHVCLLVVLKRRAG
jgi:hypothetical protein